jgi:LPXTG-motif cell wall-anchored protein
MRQIKEQVQGAAAAVDAHSRSPRYAVVEFRGFDHKDEDMDDGALPTEARVLQKFMPDSARLGPLFWRMDPNDTENIYWERSMHTGIMTAMDLDWRPGVRKVILVFSALEPDPMEAITKYTDSEIRRKSLEVDPVEIYGIDLGALDSETFRSIAEGTNGQVFDATDGQIGQAIEDAVAAALDNPEAWIAGPYVSKVGDVIELDARASYSPYGEIVSYEWDFEGDGEWDQVTTVPLLEHQFDTLFEGVVGLRVTDVTGLTGIGSTEVSITADGDATPPEEDNCPDVYNWGQEDSDGDGLGDECDPTPGVAAYEGDDGKELTAEEIERLSRTDPSSSPSGPADGGPNSPVADGSGALPATGATSPVWLRWAAIGLVLAGAGMMLSTRVRATGGGWHRR